MVRLAILLILCGCAAHLAACNDDSEEVVAPDPGGPGDDEGQDLWDFESDEIPRFLDTFYLDIEHIQKISRFRSSQGHDYSDHFECERSMKHYLFPHDETEQFRWTDIEIRAPISGTIMDVMDEWGDGIGGYQLWIQSELYPAIHVVIFHVGLAQPLQRGDTVVEGQVLGNHATGSTWSDIAIAVFTPCPPEGRDCEFTGHHFDTCGDYGVRNISVFEIMTDELFQTFTGFPAVTDRADFIIPKDERDLYPGFWDYPDEQSWVVLTPP